MTVSNRKLRLRDRVTIIGLGLAATGFGLAAMARGDFSYENWWGGLVFAPLAMVVGVLFVLGAIFKPAIFKAQDRR